MKYMYFKCGWSDRLFRCHVREAAGWPLYFWSALLDDGWSLPESTDTISEGIKEHGLVPVTEEEIFENLL